jgi:hypothetical protein
MLRVTVEIVPGGHEDQKRNIATLCVANMSGLAAVSDYYWWLDRDDHDLQADGVLHGHRRSNGWEELVSRILGQVSADAYLKKAGG